MRPRAWLQALKLVLGKVRGMRRRWRPSANWHRYVNLPKKWFQEI